MGKNGTKIIKLFLRCLFLFLFLQCPVTWAEAQSRKVKKAEREHARVLKKEKNDYEKRRKSTIKHRYKIQSPSARERMKETEKRSRKYGRKQKEQLCKRIFAKKKIKKIRRQRR